MVSTLKQDAKEFDNNASDRAAIAVVGAQNAIPLGCWEPLAESMRCRSVSGLWLQRHEADTAALSPEYQGPDSPL